jgi:RNA polymerase primary sigma factor
VTGRPVHGNDGGDLLRRYLDEIGVHPLLNASEEVQLGRIIESGQQAAERLERGESIPKAERMRLQQRCDEAVAARKRFIQANLRLVVSVARRYQGHGLGLMDLIQEGNLGLMRAVEKFDHSKGFKFSTYATWWIRQAIGRAIADTSRTIKLPAHVRESAPLVMRSIEKLADGLDRKPTPVEVAADTGLTKERVELVLIHRNDVMSLSAPVHDDGEGELSEQIEDPTLDTPFDQVAASIDRIALGRSLDRLNEREKAVLVSRFGLDDGAEQTLAQIGERFDLTRERIRQIEAKALTKLRHPCIAGLRRATVPR